MGTARQVGVGNGQGKCGALVASGYGPTDRGAEGARQLRRQVLLDGKGEPSYRSILVGRIFEASWFRKLLVSHAVLGVVLAGVIPVPALGRS